MEIFSHGNVIFTLNINKILFVLHIQKSCIFASLKTSDEKTYNK